MTSNMTHPNEADACGQKAVGNCIKLAGAS